MSIPKFPNPHSITIPFQTVSRSEVFCDKHEKGFSRITDGQDHSEELAWLEAFLQGSLSSIETKSRKPQRHLKSSTGPEDTASEFRLISSARPPQPISLEPKPPKSLRLIERVYEDNEEMAVLRHRRAEEVAVDITWIRAQSGMTYPSWPNDDKRYRHVKALSQAPANAPMLVLDQERPKSFTVVKQDALDVDKREILVCPTIKIDPKSEDTRTQRHRRLRARRKRKTSELTQGRRYGSFLK